MTHRLRQVQTMLQRLPRKNVRPPHPIQNRGNLTNTSLVLLNDCC
jgi:hypothetical protein